MKNQRDMSISYTTKVIRLSKCALLFGVTLYYFLIVFNNITDYDSNYQFVRHVLMMDSTFPNNHSMWRAINQPFIHKLFYLSIIGWEFLTGLLCGWGFIRLLRQINSQIPTFHRAKSSAIIALTLGCLLWFAAFINIGGEWFLMWQSHTWNGEEVAFRMFVILALILFYISGPEYENSSSNAECQTTI